MKFTIEEEKEEKDTVRVKPLHNYLIIEKDPAIKVSTGGIHLVRADKNTARQGTVLAVGPGVYDENGNRVECGVEVGDQIAYDRAHVKDFEVEGKVYSFLMGKGIFGVLPKKD